MLWKHRTLDVLNTVLLCHSDSFTSKTLHLKVRVKTGSIDKKTSNIVILFGDYNM